MVLRVGKILGIAALVVVIVAGLLPLQAQALTFYSSRGSMPSNDFVDWSAFGAQYDSVPNGSTTPSVNFAVPVSVSAPSNSITLRVQSSNFNGNFAAGDYLLWTVFNNEYLDVAFGSPVYAAGAQIQQSYYGDFTGTVEAFDALYNSLGSFNWPGNSNDDNDNSAIFLGVYDSLGQISLIRFSVSPTISAWPLIS